MAITRKEIADGRPKPSKPRTSESRENSPRYLLGRVKLLRAGIDDNVVTAVRKVDPGRASTLAELMAQMQRDMHRIEAALRVAAVQVELAA